MTRVFTHEDQRAFADLSGDHNPIHVDPIAARRLLFGRPVVHGIHAALWAIDQWLKGVPGLVRLTSLNIKFRTPIFIGEPVELAITRRDGGATRLDVKGGTALRVSIELTCEPTSEIASNIPALEPPRQPCRDRQPADIQSAAGRLPLTLDPILAGGLFPNASPKLMAQQLATFLCTTRLVGMELPGLHSLYMGIDLKSGGGNIEPALDYRVAKYDARFSLLTLHVTGPDLQGEISAAFRSPPTNQIAFADLRAMVQPDEFRNERALIIGGSRGLGEVAVKALSAGGADVRFTYHRGASDAQRVSGELAAIVSYIQSFPYDVLGGGANLSDRLGDWHPTLLCYFATPFIAAGAARHFSPDLFSECCGYYVKGFVTVFEAVNAGVDLRNVLYPSSVFVDELPPNMAEYAAAKAAGEVVCRALAKSHPNIAFHVPRFPRLATDQTARRTSMPVKSDDGAEVIVRALRNMIAREQD